MQMNVNNIKTKHFSVTAGWNLVMLKPGKGVSRFRLRTTTLFYVSLHQFMTTDVTVWLLLKSRSLP